MPAAVCNGLKFGHLFDCPEVSRTYDSVPMWMASVSPLSCLLWSSWRVMMVDVASVSFDLFGYNESRTGIDAMLRLPHTHIRLQPQLEFAER